MQLIPQHNFTVVRQIADHTDPSTYYVQAVIRNAQTDVIIATLNLEDKGALRFKKDWQVPADPSGLGYYISIVTSVYSDSGYTTKATSLGDEENTYLVSSGGVATIGGKGGGYGITRRDVREVVEDLLEKYRPDPIKFPKMPEMRWDEVLQAIADARAAIQPVELAPVVSTLKAVQKLIQAVHDKEPEGIEFSPITDKLANLEKLVASVCEKEDPEPTDTAPIMEALEELKDTKKLDSLIELLDKVLRLTPDIIESKLEKVLEGKIVENDPEYKDEEAKEAEATISKLSL